jgi:hypothetical protein
MSDLHERDELADQLAALGDALELREDRIVDAVLEHIDSPRRPPRVGWLVAAAAAVLIVGVVLQPGARDAMARWFGLDGVRVEVDPDLRVPPSIDRAAPPGPGESATVIVDGREVIVSAVDGRFTGSLLTKTVRSSDQVEQVDVAGRPGLWIAGGAHEVLYEAPTGDVVVQRAAGNTLLWQDGPILYRVEGFDELDDALAFAEGTRGP